ncbi:MAG: molybdate ABC transporter permease subunit [Mucispirillum sp.]|nr:molybdate ABC transporter permease subunit [Mucispirillum sp.]
MDFFSISPIELSAIKLSLLVGFWSVAASLPFGIFSGWLLARFDFTGKSLLDGFIHLPLVVPPVVTGFILLLLFGKKNGVFGPWLYETFNITFAFNWKGAALASAVVAFPLMVRSIRLSIESIDRGLEDAAKTLGASSFKVFFTITLPLAVSGIISGVVLAFARSLGEFGATVTFVGNTAGETQTLPLALSSVLQIPNQEMQAGKLAVISLILAFASLIVSEYFAKRAKRMRTGE